MSQPEARLSRSIMNALRQRGAFVFKIWGNEHMLVGLPDIIGCYRGRFIAVETKMPGGTTSRRQDYVIGKIRQAGGTVVVAQNVAEALRTLDGEHTPGDTPQALTGELRALSAPSHRRTTTTRVLCNVPACGCDGLAHA